MAYQQPSLLNEKEIPFHRMESFHRERVQDFASGMTPLKKSDHILVVHMIPESSVLTRKRFDATQLKEHGSRVYALGDRGGYSRFNVDGFMNYDGHQSIRAYSQLYRDGRLESVMSDAAYPLGQNEENGVHVLRDSIVEKALSSLVPNYLAFCKAVDLQTPIWLFSALVGCEGVRICTDWGFRDVSDHGIDRSPCHLPEIEITSLDADSMALLRPWCDTLWQACGIERSYNFDEDGNWRERRR
ncbi:MAG: hypothetical protein WD049_07225 [Candidatus Paceibacterota bacterium]